MHSPNLFVVQKCQSSSSGTAGTAAAIGASVAECRERKITKSGAYVVVARTSVLHCFLIVQR